MQMVESARPTVANGEQASANIMDGKPERALKTGYIEGREPHAPAIEPS